jgi:hypothetical protein
LPSESYTPIYTSLALNAIQSINSLYTNSIILHFPLKHFADVEGCKLHQLLLSNCTLERVNANINGFSYLHYLLLASMSVVDAVVLNIMSSCCALHLLGLKNCHQLINVRAAHAQLLHIDVYKCKSLISISIHAEKLKCFSYMGHNVDVEYQYAPVIQTLHAHFLKKNECPLERIGALPELRKLSLQFPSRLQVCKNHLALMCNFCRSCIISEVALFFSFSHCLVLCPGISCTTKQ